MVGNLKLQEPLSCRTVENFCNGVGIDLLGRATGAVGGRWIDVKKTAESEQAGHAAHSKERCSAECVRQQLAGRAP